METSEIWKDVPGYEGKYKVSSIGNVISINGRYKGEKVLSPATDPNGYFITSLRKEGVKKYYRIHQLVAMAFIVPDSPVDNCVNHKDGDKQNNHAANLEWTTRGDNIYHAIDHGLINNEGEKSAHAKLKEEDVLKIRELYKTYSAQYIGKLYSMNGRHITDIVRGICWSHLPIPDYSTRKITPQRKGYYTPKKK